MPSPPSVTATVRPLSAAVTTAGAGSAHRTGADGIGARGAQGRTGLRDLADVHADLAVIATNGSSPEVGLSTPDLAEAALKRAMAAGARRMMLLADSSKYSVQHFARFGVLDDVDILVTDAGLTDRQAAEIETHGPEVLRL